MRTQVFSFVFGFLLLAGVRAGAAPGGFGLETRPALTGLTFPAAAPLSSRYELAPAFPNLEFEKALYLTSAPGDASRLFVVEQGGKILTFANDANVSSAQVFLDLSRNLSSSAAEEGLLGLAFDPDYATNGYFYVNYTAPRPLRTVIARYQRAKEALADANSASIVLEINQPYTNHNGGMITFGPDGMLYIGMGDGGSGGDPQNNAQNKKSLLGKILRIDPRSASPYKVPADNPFVNDSAYRPEIWALGARNPWRFSFDRQTKELWVGDVGQDKYEEVDVVEKGDNLGWRPCEGLHRYPASGACPSTYKAALHEYDHSKGKSIVGGYVYRGQRLPSLRGTYLFGDTLTRTIWGLVKQGNKVLSNSELGSLPVYLSSLGEDSNGEVYFVGYGETGQIYQLEERAPSTAVFPDMLSKTGLFQDTARLVPNPGLIEYEVNQPLWSDRSLKRRWLGIPTHTSMYFDAAKSWIFPLGTVLAKHFELKLADGTQRRLETRVLIRQRDGWKGYTYKWNAAQTDAELIDQAIEETYLVSGPSGPSPQKWTYPSRADCLRCHTPGAGFVLGVNARQIDRDFAFPAQIDNQIRAWNHVGLFTGDVDGIAVDAFPAAHDTSASLDKRARAYLDVNCATCHRPAGGTPNDIDLRSETPLASTRLENVPPQNGDLGISGALRLIPGDPARSLVVERMKRKDDKRMPLVGSHVVDDEALALISDWIRTL
jgi:uncharacterized repeat protein (TIGR03806 family)